MDYYRNLILTPNVAEHLLDYQVCETFHIYIFINIYSLVGMSLSVSESLPF